jgi:hypothetical protein
MKLEKLYSEKGLRAIIKNNKLLGRGEVCITKSYISYEKKVKLVIFKIIKRVFLKVNYNYKCRTLNSYLEE